MCLDQSGREAGYTFAGLLRILHPSWRLGESFIHHAVQILVSWSFPGMRVTTSSGSSKVNQKATLAECFASHFRACRFVRCVGCARVENLWQNTERNRLRSVFCHTKPDISLLMSWWCKDATRMNPGLYWLHRARQAWFCQRNPRLWLEILTNPGRYGLQYGSEKRV